MVLTIAVDGPVGAGKSSVSDAAARELGILHLDTGAMYRAFAWKALKEGVSTNDEAALCALTKTAMPEVRFADGAQHTYIGDTDVTEFIRTQEISMAASDVSKVAGVRAAMVESQQALAREQSVLLDGRDIGTRVLPQATLKIYLTASPEVRAQRRFAQLEEKGDATPYESVLKDVVRRDEQDMRRAVDPLRPAEDAQILDTSDMSMEQAAAEIVRRARMKQGKLPKREDRFTPMYQIAWSVTRLLFRTLMPISYHGEENVQRDAPYILICNHNSMFDPLAIAGRCYRYQVRFLGKKELTKNPITKWLFKNLLMIPVDRHHSDLSALRECLKALGGGHVLGIFPEGTRYKQGVMEDMESGVAMIALRAKATLIPAYITGKPRLFHRVHVTYGQPISTLALAKKGVSKETCAELMETITETYRGMVAQKR